MALTVNLKCMRANSARSAVYICVLCERAEFVGNVS